MVSLCIKLYTVNFSNIKRLKSQHEKIFTNFYKTPSGLSSWIFGPHFSSATECTAKEESPFQQA